MTDGTKKPLSDWASWRGEVKVNKHLRNTLAPGQGLLWEGSVWVGSDEDREQLEQLIREDRLAEKATE